MKLCYRFHGLGAQSLTFESLAGIFGGQGTIGKAIPKNGMLTRVSRSTCTHSICLGQVLATDLHCDGILDLLRPKAGPAGPERRATTGFASYAQHARGPELGLLWEKPSTRITLSILLSCLTRPYHQQPGN